MKRVEDQKLATQFKKQKATKHIFKVKKKEQKNPCDVCCFEYSQVFFRANFERLSALFCDTFIYSVSFT